MARFKSVLQLFFPLALLSCGLLFALSAPNVEPLFDPNSSQVLLEPREFHHILTPGEESAADNLIIQVATLGKGDPLYVWFGHTALVITDIHNNRKVMYDYGVFSFGSGFYKTFIQGHLLYEVWATSFELRLNQAMEEDRTFSLITLDLEPSAKLELVKFLNFNLQNEYNHYLYHHYNENCATKVRDIIDKAVGGALKEWAQATESEFTIRQNVERYTAFSPVISWVINYLQSGRIDRSISRWEQMFLPLELEQALLEFSYVDSNGNEKALVKDRQLLYQQSTPERRGRILDTYRNLNHRYLLAALLLATVIALSGRSQRRLPFVVAQILNFIWLTFMGVLGLLLLYLMVATRHDVTYWNENILLTNPVLLVMAFQALRLRHGEHSLIQLSRVMLGLSLTLLVAKFLFPEVLFQNNYQVLVTLIPLFAANCRFRFPKRNTEDKHDPLLLLHSPDMGDL